MVDDTSRVEWNDHRNWHFGWLGVYCGRRDRRVIVPRRNRAFGWTVNFCNPLGAILAFVVLGLLVATIILASAGL